MKTWLLLLLGALQLCAGAKILGIISIPSKSHHYVLERLVIELAKKGHEVTFVTPYKQSKPVPGLNEIILPDLYDKMLYMMNRGNENDTSNFTNLRKLNKWTWLLMAPMIGPLFSEMILSTDQVQELIKNDKKFDLIIGETIYVEPMLAGFGYKHKIPIIGMSAFLPNYFANHVVGNPAPPAFVPDSLLAHPSRMNFWQRLDNTIFTTAMEISYQFFYTYKMDAVMRKHFGQDLPPMDEIIKNTSLLLVNHHFSLAHPRPYLPNMVEIGGYHINPPKPLPADLQKYFDESKEGVILFSMGSHMKSKDLPQETRNALLQAFSRLKQDVLWKFEDDSLSLPKNVKIAKWLPQSDILAHPNLKLFITHGGLFSTTEAVQRGVPIVGIPVGGDQYTNMKYTTEAGFGVTLELDDLNEEIVYNTIQEVLNNPKYRENVKRGSAIFNDRPLSPIDTALYWVEYVIRHKGAPHLRSAAQDLAWHQLHLLDVLAFIFVVAFLVIYISYRVSKFIVKKLACRKKAPISRHKKEN